MNNWIRKRSDAFAEKQVANGVVKAYLGSSFALTPSRCLCTVGSS